SISSSGLFTPGWTDAFFTTSSFVLLLVCRFFLVECSFEIGIVFAFLCVNLPRLCLPLFVLGFFDKNLIRYLHNRNLLPDQLFDLSNVILLRRITESNGVTLLKGPPRTSDAVHIILDHNRHIK